ncbi:MAG: DEAD/DEAH box helicase family protein, partial [Endomicrobiia bacterium]
MKEILEWDNWNIKRGVFLTLLHKFNINEKDFEVRLKDQKITQRKDIICFFDEVHRTQYGNLKLKLKNILKNTFHFGFTGTPITKIERNTFEEFSYPNEKEFYLDRYFLDEAERDGYIVPIVYQPRLEDVHLKSENIEWFIENIDFEEIGEEIAKENFNEEIKNK